VVSPSNVRRVLAWQIGISGYKPNSIWIYDTTHFTACGMAVLIIEDLVSRKWLTEVVSAEETSTQVELALTQALAAEGLLEQIQARHDDGRVDLAVDDQGPADPARRLRPGPPDDLRVDPGVGRGAHGLLHADQRLRPGHRPSATAVAGLAGAGNTDRRSSMKHRMLTAERPSG
jgi:hypothetical protein